MSDAPDQKHPDDPSQPTDPQEVDLEDGTDEDDKPVDNPAG